MQWKKLYCVVSHKVCKEPICMFFLRRTFSKAFIMSSESLPVEQTIVRRSQRISTLTRKTQVSTYSADKNLRVKSTRSVVKTVKSKTKSLQTTSGIPLEETVISQPEVVVSESLKVEKEEGPRLETFLTAVADPKTTTFVGRLGYACLNTLLRASKPNSIFCSRTCRLDTISKKGLDFVKGLALQNVRDLPKLIEWNEMHNIRFMRISSDLFPFASHGKHGYDLLFAKEELEAVGMLARKYNHRLTSHPGQFTQLASPKEDVVNASVRELEYHCQFMDLMGLDKDGVIIIHMGGTYGDKEAALDRFRKNYQERLNPRIKARLVLENDEFCYNIDELLPISQELNIPIVIDYHHDWLYPSSRPVAELMPVVNEVWHRKGIRPKQHLSSPRPGAITVMEKRSHAKRCYVLPDALPDDMDLMIEAKDKEQAVFELYRIYGLYPVREASWRPAELVADVETPQEEEPPSTSSTPRKRKRTTKEK